ncbi:zinc ribbon domain-containing protein [Halorubrum sp. BOL3-1]|uniref:zinc ribbon domain-containing protein n=1 Tax=Halorubrum sp. BOL3-1 TaxID=2497325 RepID=UPI00100500F8|nr:zinc ribbon domain-containing protein [Halorubrum sp. BOL3-1]QAU13481.1 zinc ribbon domain-containing protein [Halorubrum sp. BOL3-1]
MPSCPRCDAPTDDGDRYCAECGAPQTEDAAEELDEYVQRQAQQISGGGGSGEESGGDASSDGLADMADLSDREQLWRRGCYVLGYGTTVVALTFVPAIGAFPLILAGIVILPPLRRLTAEPLGSSLKREVMAGLYAILALIGVALLIIL